VLHPGLRKRNWRKVSWMVVGLILFAAVFFSPQWGATTDPLGEVVKLSEQGKLAIGLFMLAVVWWVFEVLPIGITGIAIGVIQALFMIRDPRVAMTDFMDPSVWFIIGSLVIGKAFSKTGITKRIAYRMLIIVGEKTSMIYLGCFVLTALLTMTMAHTAVAAAIFPVLFTIYGMYSPDFKPTNFGKGLFIGMAFSAGAGSIVTLLGAARGAVALGYYSDIVGREISFFELSKYMFPVGWSMVLIIWLYMLLIYPPERKTVTGLRDKAILLSGKIGPIKMKELATLVIVFGCLAMLTAQAFVPALKLIPKSAVILTGTIMFFILRILRVDDLEEVPWNIVLLFGGAMSLGFCLWETGAARWMAVQWLGLIQNAPWFWFIMGLALLMLIMTNLVMNVAAVAILLPVGLTIAQYLNVSPELVLFSSLVVAGMPFLFLIGAAPNAIAYESSQFSAGEFFKAGIPASIILLLVLMIFVRWIWPLMGMPVTAS
jgi:solute carrier family 13 (sodium-dependent dicarboxylate transporter), member 2/3/5